MEDSRGFHPESPCTQQEGLCQELGASSPKVAPIPAFGTSCYIDLSSDQQNGRSQGAEGSVERGRPCMLLVPWPRKENEEQGVSLTLRAWGWVRWTEIMGSGSQQLGSDISTAFVALCALQWIS